jgi:predicted permease
MLGALFPVFALILIGVFLKRIGFPGDGFWRGAERITYYLLFPSLLFLKLSTISISGAVDLPQLIILLVAILLVISALLILLGYVFGIYAATFTSLFQGGIRFNTYVGLAVIDGLLGDTGLAIAAIVVGIMIPVVNLLCIAVFVFVDERAKTSVTSIISNIISNPLIIACVSGVLWNRFGFVIPDLVFSVLRLLSMTALPLGLLSVGAGVYLKSLGDVTKSLILSSVVKLVVSPLLACLSLLVMGQSHVVTLVVVVIASLPTASSAYILSRELGGDPNSMAAIITGQTLIAMTSMPFVISCVTWVSS